jgi:hypothetical protein
MPNSAQKVVESLTCSIYIAIRYLNLAYGTNASNPKNKSSICCSFWLEYISLKWYELLNTPITSCSLNLYLLCVSLFTSYDAVMLPPWLHTQRLMNTPDKHEFVQWVCGQEFCFLLLPFGAIKYFYFYCGFKCFYKVTIAGSLSSLALYTVHQKRT